ncbi:MAG: methyltransferase domain-containing protein [Dehalococcoidia bacterium]
MSQPSPEASSRKQPYWSFLREFVRARRIVGAVAPTSKGVGRRMAQLAGVRDARSIAEFGPGTGAITHELLDALPADGRLWGFEIYPPFVQHLSETIKDPRLTVLTESAEAIAGLRERETSDGFDAVISSIPFSLIGPEQTFAILRAVSQSLRPGGIFVALQYHPRYLAPHLRAEFASVEREVYPWNIPPATLLSAHTPRSAQ